MWIGNSINTEEEWGRRFYEVITDTDVIAMLKDRMSSDKTEEVQSSEVKDYPGDESDGTRYIH
jgi:hypothetical protein